LVFAGILGGVLGSAMICTYFFQKYLTPLQEQPAEVITKEITQLQDEDIVSVVENVSPSVVSVVVSKDVPQYQQLYNSPFDLFFGVPQQQDRRGQEQQFEKQKIGGGTGFFVSSDGMIVTNRHVVADTTAEYTVLTEDGTEYPAVVLARDDVLDFAVLKVEGDGFTAVTLGDSDGIKIGQTAIAIGNSLGEFSHSVSRGIISGMQRNITAGSGFGDTEDLTNIIQTDAAINFGNSGGPLLDVQGKVIGINTAVAQGAENIGFAIPINQVMRLIDDVKETGKITRPFIGVRYVPVNKEIQDALDVDYEHGVLVVRGDAITDFAVLPGSPADKAGIVENDIILEINGTKIDEKNTMAQLIAQHGVGDTIEMKVWHKGVEKNLSAILEEKKSE
jgi:S1-C subfamily serine protease